MTFETEYANVFHDSSEEKEPQEAVTGTSLTVDDVDWDFNLSGVAPDLQSALNALDDRFKSGPDFVLLFENNLI